MHRPVNGICNRFRRRLGERAYGFEAIILRLLHLADHFERGRNVRGIAVPKIDTKIPRKRPFVSFQRDARRAIHFNLHLKIHKHLSSALQVSAFVLHLRVASNLLVRSVNSSLAVSL